MTVNLATEFAMNDIPIRVNCIAPGAFPSQMMADSETLNRNIIAAPFPGCVRKAPLLRAGR